MKIPHLTPQIIKDNLAEYARSHGQDEEVTEVMQEAKKRGYMTKDDLVAVADWKYTPNKKNCEKNNDGFVEKVTKIAFAPDCDEEVRIKILRIIDGVEWAMASVILHFAFPSKYPILDENVMGIVKGDTNYNFGKWQEYSCICRKARVEYGLTMRNLDRVLWQMGDGKKKKEKKQ